MMDLVCILYDDRYRYKDLFSCTPNHTSDLMVKGMDRTFMFCVKVFNSLYFPDHKMI